MLVVIKVFFDHLNEILYSEGFSHELITTCHLGFSDILLKGIGTEGDDGSIVINFLDNAGGVETVHLRHADVH